MPSVLIDYFFDLIKDLSIPITTTVIKTKGSACAITPISPSDEKCLSHLKTSDQLSNEVPEVVSITWFTILKTPNPIMTEISRMIRIRLVIFNMVNDREMVR